MEADGKEQASIGVKRGAVMAAVEKITGSNLMLLPKTMCRPALDSHNSIQAAQRHRI